MKLRRSLLALLTLTAALVTGEGTSSGQSQPGRFAATPEELEAYRLFHESKPLAAGTKARAILKRSPKSIAANYVLGCVLREAEGSLPRAMYHYNVAREEFEKRYPGVRPVGSPWALHEELLVAIQGLAGSLEDHEYQLQVLEYHDYLYDPDLIAEHAWPLMRLGRFEEARTAARSAKGMKDLWQRSLGHNALCAIEGEAHQREAYFEACKEALTLAQSLGSSSDPNSETAPHIAVHAYNAALSAYSVLRHDEVERLALLATRRVEFTTANPWRLLGRLFLDAGRMDEAVAALREMQKWRVRQPAHLRDQDRAETDVTVAAFLLVAGETDTAERLITNAINLPDRRGMVSSVAEQALGAHALLRRMIIHAQAERLRERASWSGFWARLGAPSRAQWLRLEAVAEDQRISAVLSDAHILDNTLQIYLRGGIEPLSVWMLGDLIDVIGPGVFAVALRKARAAEKTFPGLAPYYDALQCELSLAGGDAAQALDCARKTLSSLPKAESLLKARVAAIGAEAARKAGDRAAELSLLGEVLQRDASVLRRKGMSLPVTFQAQGPLAKYAAELLSHSPRLREQKGFSLVVEAPGPALRACLRGAAGESLSCAEVAAKPKENSDSLAKRLAEEFHRVAFSAKVTLTETDRRSLDGSTTASREASREQMDKLMDDITGEKPQ